MKKYLTLLVLALIGYSAPSYAAVVGMDSFGTLAKESIENGYIAALGVLGTGVTILGAFKGYGYIKQGIKKS